MSGGASDFTAAEPITESAIAKNLLTDMGVSAERIELEERSLNNENAERSAAVAEAKAGKTWLLVTSAGLGPEPGKPVIVGAGMMGDRVSIIFASVMDLTTFVVEDC